MSINLDSLLMKKDRDNAQNQEGLDISSVIKNEKGTWLEKGVLFRGRMFRIISKETLLLKQVYA
jgi:hypothetical protein